jgi:hypothetical protein
MYWTLQRLNAAGREVVTNSILISSMLYFLAIWCGTKAGIARATSKVRNFFWSGSVTRTRARVSWKQCCLRREDGGLNLIDPHDAVTALMAK